MILLASCILHWRIEHARDITPASLKLFTLLHPKPDIVVLGTGDDIVHLSEECREFLRKHRIAVEVQRTENAVATYNFLSVEDRIVAGAFCLVTREAVLKKMTVESYEESEVYTEPEVASFESPLKNDEKEPTKSEYQREAKNLQKDKSSVEKQSEDHIEKTRKQKKVSGRVIQSHEKE